MRPRIVGNSMRSTSAFGRESTTILFIGVHALPPRPNEWAGTARRASRRAVRCSVGRRARRFITRPERLPQQ
jgi:hypothetical protein